MNDIVTLDACSVSTLTESPAAATLEELPQRVRDIATLRGLGYTFREISEQFGVTPQRSKPMCSSCSKADATAGTKPSKKSGSGSVMTRALGRACWRNWPRADLGILQGARPRALRPTRIDP